MNENKFIINVDESFKILKKLRNGYLIAPISSQILSDIIDDETRTIEIKFNIYDVKLKEQFEISNKMFKTLKMVYVESTLKNRVFKFNTFCF